MGSNNNCVKETIDKGIPVIHKDFKIPRLKIHIFFISKLKICKRLELTF